MLDVEHDARRASALQNKLAAVVINAELAAEMLPPGEARRRIEQALAAALAASDLLRRDEGDTRGATRAALAGRGIGPSD